MYSTVLKTHIRLFPEHGDSNTTVPHRLEGQFEINLECRLTMVVGGCEVSDSMAAAVTFPTQKDPTEVRPLEELFDQALAGLRKDWASLLAGHEVRMYEEGDEWEGNDMTITLQHQSEEMEEGVKSDFLHLRGDTPIMRDLHLKCPCSKEQLQDLLHLYEEEVEEWIRAQWSLP